MRSAVMLVAAVLATGAVVGAPKVQLTRSQAPAAPLTAPSTPADRAAEAIPPVPQGNLPPYSAPASPAPSIAPFGAMPGSPAVVGNTTVTGSQAQIDRCLVTLINDVPLSSQEPGTITEIKVEEGDHVAKDDLLARVDDTLARTREEVAMYKLDVAKKEADNDINVRYSDAAAQVASAEVERAKETNRKHPNTVPLSDQQRLWLQYRQAVLGKEQAEHELGIAKVQINVQQAELKAAQEDVRRRQIIAPFEGVIVDRYREVAEWVQAGEPILRLVRMDKLWVEGWVDARQVNQVEVEGQPVTVVVNNVPFQGKVVFASPIIEAGSRFQVKAEVENRQQGGFWLLQPGWDTQMTIQLKR